MGVGGRRIRDYVRPQAGLERRGFGEDGGHSSKRRKD